jgi:hypothetical protein
MRYQLWEERTDFHMIYTWWCLMIILYVCLCEWIHPEGVFAFVACSSMAGLRSQKKFYSFIFYLFLFYRSCSLSYLFHVFLFLVDYFTTLSVPRLWNCKTSSNRVLVGVISRHIPEMTEEKRIRTEHLPNTNPERYRCTSALFFSLSSSLLPHVGACSRFGA